MEVGWLSGMGARGLQPLEQSHITSLSRSMIVNGDLVIRQYWLEGIKAFMGSNKSHGNETRNRLGPHHLSKGSV